jgi:hypothetical protein
MRTLDQFQPRPGSGSLDAKVIVLCGREWIVPPLGMRQNRVVVPLVWKIQPIRQRAALSALELEAAKKSEDGARILEAEKNDVAVAQEILSEEVLGDLTQLVFVALTRAYDITLDEFLDLPIDPRELMRAFEVISLQTQLFTAVKNGGRQTSDEGETSTARQT